MKKLIRSLAILLYFISMQNVQAQKQEKIYYDYAWEQTTADNASYYRLINFDKNNKVVGLVRDYYMNGKLQFEGEALSIDLSNDDNSKFKNKTTGYYENGKKEFEKNYDAFGNVNGPTKTWDEDGVLTYSFHFDDKDLFNLEYITKKIMIDDLMSMPDNQILDDIRTIKRTKDKVGNNVFGVYRKNNLVEKFIISIEEKFIIGMNLAVGEVTNAEKDLSKKGFHVIFSKSVGAIGDKDPYVLKKWARDDYPFRFITIQINGKNNILGSIDIVSSLSSEY
jgi:antitoxin component YwqK of YwqJK toxin-antitoxin module